MASVPNFLTGPLERIEPAAGATQVLVITADPETAVALAEAVLRMTGPAGIELLPVTTARRAKRLFADRPVLAAAGSPKDIRDLLKGSQLKLDSIKSVVLAWADEILSSGEEDVAALEAIMSEIPKDAARIVVTSRSEGRVNAFAERYLRRARRESIEEIDENAEPVSIQYVMASRSSRTNALRRLLDDIDPPSAAIVVADDQSEKEAGNLLRMLGYHEGTAAVRVSRGEIQPSTYAVIFFDAPTSRNAIATASAANPVALVSLVDTRDLAALKRIPGAEVRPFTLSSAGNAARERESLVRRELENVIESGVASRELLSLEPLLERYDGVEIAAAALRLLERERSMRKAQEEAKPRERPPFDRPRERGSFDRPPRERGSFDRPRDLARGKERDFSRGRDSERRDPRKGPPRGREGGRDGGRDGGRHGGRDNRSPRRDRS
jgi:ATP-dependent RNA helicase DeaD